MFYYGIPVADATGRLESGVLDGNALFEGRHLQCKNANNRVDDIIVEPLYCSSFWDTLLPTLDNPPMVNKYVF